MTELHTVHLTPQLARVIIKKVSKNPRKADPLKVEQLKQEILKKGFVLPVVA